MKVKMWFRLKEDFEITEENKYWMKKGVKKIKKGAIVFPARFEQLSSGWFKPDYYFENKHRIVGLRLTSLELPQNCTKDSYGTVFCTTQEEYFHGMGYGELFAEQIICCPICGKKVKKASRVPYNDLNGGFLIK